MLNDWLSYAGELVDDAPLVLVVYSSTWRKYILALAEYLRQREIWNPTDDIDLAIQQADAFKTLLLGESIVLADLMSLQHTVFFGSVNLNDHAKTPTPFLASSHPFGVVWQQNAAADADFWSIWLPLQARAYKLDLIGFRHTAGGKTEIETIGGVIAGSLFDWYAAAPTPNIVQTIDFTVSADGEVPILIRVNGKNAASSGYYSPLTALMLRVND
jgi:hypothetical protein